MSRTQIIDKAEAIARREGLDSVTVRRLSAELGVTPAAMYWHLDDKQDLVRSLVDRASARTERPGPDYGSWFERLVRFYVSTREEFTAYAGLSGALVTAEPTDATLENCLFAIELLIEGGFDEPAALTVFDTLSTFSWGHLMMIDVGRFDRRHARSEAIATYADRVRAVIEKKPEYALLVRDYDDARSLAQLVRGIELIVGAALAEAGLDTSLTTTQAATAT